MEVETSITEIKVNLDDELQCIIEDIMLLKQSLKSTRSFVVILRKQVKEAIKLQQELDQQLSKQRGKKAILQKKLENGVFYNIGQWSNVVDSTEHQTNSVNETVVSLSKVEEPLQTQPDETIISQHQMQESCNNTTPPVVDDSTTTTQHRRRKYRKRAVNRLTCIEAVPSECTNAAKKRRNVSAIRYCCQICASSFAHVSTLEKHVQKKNCYSWPQVPLRFQNTGNADELGATAKGNPKESDAPMYVYTCPICQVYCSSSKAVITKHVNSKICLQQRCYGVGLKLASAATTDQPQAEAIQKLYTCPICKIFVSIRKRVIVAHVRSRVCQTDLHPGYESVNIEQQLLVTDKTATIDLATLLNDGTIDKVLSGTVQDGATNKVELRRTPNGYVPAFRYQCSKCELCFLFKRSFDNHVVEDKCQNKQEQEINNPVSQQKKPRLKSVARVKKQSNSGSSLSQAVSCFTCGNSDVTEWSEHRRTRDRVCLECDKLFLDSVQIANSTEYDEYRRMSSNRYVCVVCKKSWDDLGMIWRHLRSHTGYRPHVCDKCGKGFVSNTDVELHVMRYHRDQSTWCMCEICSKRFPTKYSMKEHILKVHGEKSFQCAVCNAAFTRDSTLRVHMRYHTGDRRHVCSLCPKRFVRYQDLVLHMPFHSDKKEHQCPMCPKAFKWRSYLTKHIQSHAE